MIVDDWLARSRPRAVAIAVAGAALIVAGVVVVLVVSHIASSRVRNGTPVVAEVVGLRKIGLGHFGGQEVDVQYTFHHHEFRTRLMSVWPQDFPLASDHRVTLYIDPSNPQNAATKDSWTTDDKTTLISPGLIAVGLVGLILGLVGILIGGRAGPRKWEMDVGGDGLPKPLMVEHDIPVVRNGYDKTSVESLLRLATRAQLLEDGDLQRQAATAIRSRDFPRNRRGYEDKAVDELFLRILLQLEQSDSKTN